MSNQNTNNKRKVSNARARERMSGEGKVVCVTGASGFIASWLVNLLLQRGYTVKASVRNLIVFVLAVFSAISPSARDSQMVLAPTPRKHVILAKFHIYPVRCLQLMNNFAPIQDDQRKTEHLLALDGAKERLHLFQADLLEEGSFDSIVDGCEGVFHTASPVQFSVTDPQAELIDPALKGTINVLRSCAKVPSVKRVVLTSSLAAVTFNRKMLIPGVLVDETWFSDPLFCEESKLWYQLSKTLAEEAAWKFAKEYGIDMVTINPGWVIGPLLQPTVNSTVEVVLNLINGTSAAHACRFVWYLNCFSFSSSMIKFTPFASAESFPNATYRWVDVRDVANAHIQAFEIPSASGRYCVVHKPAHFSEVVRILHELYPALDLPDKQDDSTRLQLGYHVVSEKAKSLGIDFTPFEVSLKDTVESLKEKNFLAV
ncbi:hypothetical protein RHMOL_Rhmol07G0071400 [Rhododendron molle]|uniref:Uncharacterized protein n=1 Tax=Rhododendron molle TaxID=49168 RepID=A0ACC0MZ74_RHOML|nr:hypothetical protein RHMOL_Rhmol07G0071400 [Rhododendron molle]